jgi:predicted metal-dependent hydrolase
MTKNKSFISQHTTHSREVYSVITVLERERESERERFEFARERVKEECERNNKKSIEMKGKR